MMCIDRQTILLSLLSLKIGDKTYETLKLLIIIGSKTLGAEEMYTLEVKCELRCMCGRKRRAYLDDCLHSLLCVGGILLTLLLTEKLKLVVMSEIGSRHLSFGNVARRCV